MIVSHLEQVPASPVPCCQLPVVPVAEYGMAYVSCNAGTYVSRSVLLCPLHYMDLLE